MKLDVAIGLEAALVYITIVEDGDAWGDIAAGGTRLAGRILLFLGCVACDEQRVLDFDILQSVQHFLEYVVAVVFDLQLAWGLEMAVRICHLTCAGAPRLLNINTLPDGFRVRLNHLKAVESGNWVRLRCLLRHHGDLPIHSKS